MNHFYAYLSRMKHIYRWGMMRNTEHENIKEHSFDVAVIAHALAVIHNTYFNGQYDEAHVISIAIFHDAGEVITGDIATPIKYFNPEIKRAYKGLETLARYKLVSMLPEELQGKYQNLLNPMDEKECRLIKYADKITAYIKCIEEIKSGNREFEKAQLKIENDLDEIDDPAVKYFIEHCLPSYELSLDELN